MVPPLKDLITPDPKDPALEKCGSKVEQLKVFNSYYLNKMQDSKKNNTIDFRSPNFIKFFDLDAVSYLRNFL
jgi:hypothetical protein